MNTQPPGHENQNQPEQKNYQEDSLADLFISRGRQSSEFYKWILKLFDKNNLWNLNKDQALKDALNNPLNLYHVFVHIYNEQIKILNEEDRLLNQVESLKNSEKKFLEWLAKNFGIVNINWTLPTKEIAKGLNNPQSVLDALARIYNQIIKIEQIEIKNNELHSILTQKTQNVVSLQQEIQQLRQQKHTITQLQKRIDDLERENKELNSRVTSLLSKLDKENRDKAVTITSDDSLRQRDSLTQDFIRLNTQDFTAVSNELFNYRCQINSDLKSDRKAEIARIKSLLSKKIFQEGRDLFISDRNLFQKENLSSIIKDFADDIIKQLIISEDQSTEVPRNNLDKLIDKGLNLLIEILNAQPPGEFLIEDEGSKFNPERHQAVTGCESGGKILYTTYPGYCVNNRIIGDALKAYVYTVSEQEFDLKKTENNQEEKLIDEQNSSDTTISGSQTGTSNTTVTNDFSGSYANTKNSDENLSNEAESTSAL
ncbi:hypothetical protein IQ276_005075 [Desmonostoc muscorum LEGE 12446]|nr:hypothetical protein [Desmonostoc muscorum]MCF2145842.1 hypothetical protein [Desmonostoc muscorum LEGE 12446]